ncbi:MAG: RICIN domain-containing protein [Deltaproteobacteria bacterium]
MKQRAMGTLVGLVGGMLLAGCAADYAGYAEYEGDEAETEATFGAAQQAVAACSGDSLQYDFNAFAASLAVASAKDFGEWDSANNFVVSSGKLALSSTAKTFCGTGCSSVKDMLLLQEDVTAGIPNHSPLEYRNHLVTWHNANMARLTELVTESRLPPGSYQFKNKYTSKNMVVDASSTAEGALIEQGPLAGTAGDWVVSVSGTKHKLQNKNSGKCLDLASASSTDGIGLVQKTCSTAATQLFDVIKQDGGLYSLKTTYGKQVVVKDWNVNNDAKLNQVAYQDSNSNGSWYLNPVGGTSNPATTIFKGMYALSFANTATTLVAAPISAAEGAQVKLATYSATNQLHNWYAAVVNGKYQFINLGSGKCLALASDSSTALLVQKTCAVNDSQLFTPTAQTQAQQFTLKTRYSTILEVQNAGLQVGTPIAQTATMIGDPHRRARFSPIMAAEPHKLTFDHVSHDGPCGDYFWYNITQPSGAPMADPLNTFIDLIFVGGKKTRTGADENPFIAQIASGGQVALDPAGYMGGGSSGTSGSCIQSDMYSDSTKTAGGTCCIKYTGVQSTFKVSSWSSTTFLCQ